MKQSAAKKFNEAIEQHRKEHGYSWAQSAGMLLSNAVFRINGICEVAGNALEDANEHALAWVMLQAAKNGTLPEKTRKAVEEDFAAWIALPPEEKSR